METSLIHLEKLSKSVKTCQMSESINRSLPWNAKGTLGITLYHPLRLASGKKQHTNNNFTKLCDRKTHKRKISLLAFTIQ